MKKNDFLLVGSVALYTYLFYNQSAGINFFLFTAALIFLAVYKNGLTRNLMNLPLLLAIVGSIASSICVVIYGNTLSVIATILSLSLVSAYSIDRHTSLVFAALYSIYSYITSIIMMVVDGIERRNAQQTKSNTPLKISLFILPLLVFVLFFVLYRESNPLFKNFTASITFDFITWPLFRFALMGFILLYGFVYHKQISLIQKTDAVALNTMNPSHYTAEKNTLFGFNLSIANESISGIFLFSILNLLLLSVNALDFQYLWLSQILPEGMTFSESVHQGIGTLITSIVFAVLIILVYFRGNLNFDKSGKTIKLLAYLWIVQNACMVASTLLRNQFYIQEYSLTYKRIGVYVYLILCLIGLFTTLIKIIQAKSNWYLFRSNSWIFYGVLIISCAFPWDRMITEYNLRNSKNIDLEYLVSLSDSNTDQLLLYAPVQKKSDTITSSVYRSLHIKLYNLLDKTMQQDWQSWNQTDKTTTSAILSIEKTGALNQLDLSSSPVKSLKGIASFSHLKELNLYGTSFKNLEELAPFKRLETLDLSNNELDSIDNLPKLAHLSELTLRKNRLRSYTILKNTPSITKLDISFNSQTELNSLPSLPKLKTLNISGNKAKDLAYLINYPTLEELQLNSTNPNYVELIPILPSLKTLEISNSNLTYDNQHLIRILQKDEQLEKLDLSSNSIHNLYLTNVPLFEACIKSNDFSTLSYPYPTSLKELTICSNKLYNLSGIERLENLENLNVSRNILTRIQPIQSLTKLKKLSLSENKFATLADIGNLVNLTSLEADANEIKDIQVLTNLGQLTYLSLSNNSILDVYPLRTLSSLTYLNLSGNSQLVEIMALNGLKNLEELHLENCSIQDLTPIYSLKKLKRLYVSVTPQQLEALKKQFPTTEIISDQNYATVDQPIY